MRILHLIGIAFVAAAIPAWAGETVILRTGFRMHADRHEVNGPKLRLFVDGGFAEMPTDAVEGFEPDAVLASVAPSAQTPVPTAVHPVLHVAESVSIQSAMPLSPVELASQAALKFALPESFVRSVMKAESGFQPRALSPKGAIGLMQLMPSTARTLGVDPGDPRQNVEGGAQYLRELLAKYENNPDQVLLALAAYNAGPGAVEKYHGVPPYRETREYILRVLKNWDRTDGR